MIKKWVSIFCFIFMMVTTVVWAKPDSAYWDNGDGTVTDLETRLMWQQGTDPSEMNWDGAKSYCGGMSLAGYKDWRLPTLDELMTLVDYTQTPLVINQKYFPMYFPNLAASWYWSSNTIERYGNLAWLVEFYYGYDKSGSKYNGFYVRAVRGGQPGSLDNLVISPLSQTVTSNAGSTTFRISNTGTGTGTIPWRAAVTAGSDWLSISSGAEGTAEGTHTGTITCAYTANTSTSSRTGTIRVTAYGDGTSTKDVTVILTQADACTATIDDKLLLHIPYLSSGKLLRWADLVNVFDDKNPTLILFKLTNYGVIENPSFSCEASTLTLSDDLKIIHIPDVLLPDGVTHLWVDLKYSQSFSTAEDDYFEAKNYEKISN